MSFHAVGHFVGLGGAVNADLWTKRGPLVKDWGDDTPATVPDVHVYVGAAQVEVQVAEVNPYIGKITTTIPIPLLPPDDPDALVTVDYQWIPTPIMALTELNTEGLVLNKWDRDGRIEGSDNRFPFSVVLGPLDRPEPLYIGHRYIGFEKSYSALLNSPTTLVLNQPPGLISVERFERAISPFAYSYNAVADPSPAWSLYGTDAGQTNVGEGTYTVKDTLSDPSGPSMATYYRPIELPYYNNTVDPVLSASTYFIARFQVDSATLDGVFTGVGFGVHDNLHLYLLGALVVNGVRHVGLLLDPEYPELASSWRLGPKTVGDVDSSTSTVRFRTADLPTGLVAGNRFQILDPAQMGVYTITSVVRHTDASTVLTVTPGFPDDSGEFGNRTVTAYFETDWRNQATYWLRMQPAQASVQVSIAGALTRTDAITLTEDVPALPSPVEGRLFNLDLETGKVFWGSLSRVAKSESEWWFFRYGVTPDRLCPATHETSALLDMSVLPEDAPEPWFPTSTGATLSAGSLLISKGDTQYPFGYERTEFFLTPQAYLDLHTEFSVPDDLATGSVLRVRNTKHDILLGTLLYAEGWPGSGAKYRQLVKSDWIALNVPSWDSTAMSDWVLRGSPAQTTGTPRGTYLNVTHTPDPISGAAQGYYDWQGAAPPLVSGRTLTANVAIKNAVPDPVTGRTGLHFWAEVVSAPPPVRVVGIEFVVDPGIPTDAYLRLTDDGSHYLQDFAFNWLDGLPHTYSILSDPGTGNVTLMADGVALGVALLADFTAGPGVSPELACFGVPTPTEASCEYELRVFTVVLSQPLAVKYTLGIWKGGPKDDIDSWEIPRTDSTSAKNSAQVGPVIEEMDWRAPMQVRLFYDPGWGVSVYRPDMGPTPYYTVDSWTTETTEPSAAWINLEVPLLPKEDTAFGSVSFGVLSADVIGAQEWSSLAYKTFKAVDMDWRAPQHMVLNQCNVFASGEVTLDATPQVLAVQTMDEHHVTLLPTGIYAERVFQIVDGSHVYGPDEWSWDEPSQLATLIDLPDRLARPFSGPRVPVTITFAPASPGSVEYLQTRPLLKSVTLLNEGTPPVPWGQHDDPLRLEIPSGTAPGDGALLDPADPVVMFRDTPGSIYEGIEFFTLDNTTTGGEQGLIALIGEGMLPDGFSGWSDSEGRAVGAFVMEFSGNLFHEPNAGWRQPRFGYGGASKATVFYACGGNYYAPTLDSTLSPGTQVTGVAPLGGVLGPYTIFYPNRSPSWSG